MPRRDGTGPLGQGPLTGRRNGCCNFRRSNQEKNREITSGDGNYSDYSQDLNRRNNFGGGRGIVCRFNRKNRNFN